MGAVQEFRKGPIFDCANLTAQIFAKGNRFSEVRAFTRYLDAFEPALANLERMRPTNPTGRGRPPKYTLEQLFAPSLAALIFNSGLTQSCQRIMSDDLLRLRLGYPLIDSEMFDRIAQANTDEEITDPNLPTRQSAVNFVRTALPRQMPGLEWLSDFAYVELPYLIKQEFAQYADYSAVTIDSSRVRAIRSDREATKVGKTNTDTKPARRLGSVIAAKGAPVVLYGDCTTVGELAFGRNSVPEVMARAEAMAIRAERDGVPWDLGRPTLWTGDTLFHDNELTGILYDHRCVGLFRVKDWPSRTFKETFIGSGVDRLGNPFTTTITVATDGTLFCECDERLEINKRTPTNRFIGRPGRTGFIHIACNNPVCPRYGARIHVSFNRFRTSDGTANLRLVTPVDPADIGNLAILRNGTQAIEHLHSQMLLQYGLAADDTRGRRVITGDDAHRFYYLLGHALWNLTILFNLRDGRATLTPVTAKQRFDAEIRNKRHIENKKQRGAAATKGRYLTAKELDDLNVAVFN